MSPAGGWRVERHPRMLADITGNRRADIVDFGDAGVYVAHARADGSFGATIAPIQISLVPEEAIQSNLTALYSIALIV